MKTKFYNYIQELQNEITGALEELDGKASFQQDIWERKEGGGGRTRVIENGSVFEKGGVNISAVHGELPKAMQNYFKVGDVDFLAYEDQEAPQRHLPPKLRQDLVDIIQHIRDGKKEDQAIEQKLRALVGRLRQHHHRSAPSSLLDNMLVKFHGVHPRVIPRLEQLLWATHHKKIQEPLYCFIHHPDFHTEDLQGATQYSLQALLQVDCQLAHEVTPQAPATPLQEKITFKHAPQNVFICIPKALSATQLTVPTTIELPAECTEQTTPSVYRLQGIHSVSFHKSTENDKQGVLAVRGATYFQWNSQWFKITQEKPIPQPVNEQAARKFVNAAVNNHRHEQLRYLYEKVAS